MFRSRRGSAIMEILISLGFITFVLFFPIAMFSINHRQTAMSTMLIHSLQIVSLNGGLPSEARDMVLRNAEQLGFDPAEVLVNAEHNGVDLTNIRISKGNTEPIRVILQYPADAEIRFLNNILGAFGLQQAEDGYFVEIGYVHSEWVE